MSKEIKHNFKKKYGQNFLQDVNIIQKMVSSVDLTKDDLVIEIGPGSGAMTKFLTDKSKVIAYEIDNDLKSILEPKFAESDVQFIWDDFLNRDILNDISSYNYKKLYVIANLPYYITTPIIIKIINSGINIDKMIIMVQKEVAERFSALPGTKDYSSITVFLNYYFNIKKILDVSRKCFYPSPNVDSAVISLERKTNNVYVKNEEVFFKLIKDSFQFKRKTLRNNLKNYDLDKIFQVLKKYDLDLTIRAESIPLEIFIEIANNL